MRADERMPKLRLVAEPFSVIPISRFQTAHLVPAARCPRPGFASLLRSPAKRVGGAPIRRPYVLTSPQVAPDYFKGLAFFSCAPSRCLYHPQSTSLRTWIELWVDHHARLEQAFRLLRTKRSP